MKTPNIKTKVVHSATKSAWNVVGDTLGGKYKIARVPYHVSGNDIIDHRDKDEAFQHAEFISWCFNNADSIQLP